jgi:hypothetical protein
VAPEAERRGGGVPGEVSLQESWKVASMMMWICYTTIVII